MHCRYHVHTRKYVCPSVITNYREERRKILAMLDKLDGINSSNDGQCDSRGKSAKYGWYSSIENTKNKVIDIQLVQVSIMINYISLWTEESNISIE